MKHRENVFDLAIVYVNLTCNNDRALVPIDEWGDAAKATTKLDVNPPEGKKILAVCSYLAFSFRSVELSYVFVSVLESDITESLASATIR